MQINVIEQTVGVTDSAGRFGEVKAYEGDNGWEVNLTGYLSSFKEELRNNKVILERKLSVQVTFVDYDEEYPRT